MTQLFQGVASIGDQLPYEHLRKWKEDANAAGPIWLAASAATGTGWGRNATELFNQKDVLLSSKAVSPGQLTE